MTLKSLKTIEDTEFYFQLPGHKGTVTSVDFHPKEPISTSYLLYLDSLWF